MNNHIKYPKTGSVKDAFHTLLKNGYEDGDELILSATEKLHGTNCSVVISWDKEKNISYQIQSRNRILTEEDDHYSFAKAMNPVLFNLKDRVFDADGRFINRPLGWLVDDNKVIGIAIYGELIGKGICNGTMINSLPIRQWVIFEMHLLIGDSEPIRIWWANPDRYLRQIFDTPNGYVSYITDYPQLSPSYASVNSIEWASNQINDWVNQIEEGSKVGEVLRNRYGYDLDLPESYGEGVVVKIIYKGKPYYAKAKCKSYSETPLSKPFVESQNKVYYDVGKYLTDEVINQGIEYLKEMDYNLNKASIPIFIKWVTEDVLSEHPDAFPSDPKEHSQFKKFFVGRAIKLFKDKLEALETF